MKKGPQKLKVRHGYVSGILDSPGCLEFVFEVSNLFMSLPQGYGWFTVMFHSAFEVKEMTKFARELKMRSNTPHLLLIMKVEKVKRLFCRM